MYIGISLTAQANMDKFSLAWSKFEAFADDKLDKMVISLSGRLENTVGQRENPA